MKHRMGLQPRYYDYIKDGTKRIELRLYDEKRQKIEIGDIIEFCKDEDEKMEVQVIGLLRYSSFKDLLNDFSVGVLGDASMTKKEILDALSEFYTTEKQRKFGVLGIRIKPIKRG